MQVFDEIIFFEVRTIQQKTVKPTYLCPLGARKLAEGKGHETACKKTKTNKEILTTTFWIKAKKDTQEKVCFHSSRKKKTNDFYSQIARQYYIVAGLRQCDH